MSLVVNPELLREIKQYGAFDISACFNCGNCTAVCPLSDELGSFPRKLIRLGQLGDRARLLAGPEPWLCYYCGECSETCPRQAEPGEYMAAMRRYATASSEPTGLARLMYRNNAAAALVTILMGIVAGAFLAVSRAGTNPGNWVFGGVSYEAIHLIGMGVGVAAGLTIVLGAGIILARMLRGAPQGTAPVTLARVVAATRRTVREIASMSRHRECTPGVVTEPWYQRTAWIHMAIMLGFLGLLVATTLDFLFLVLLPLHLTIFWPARVLGTVAGLVMLYGVIVASWRRFRKAEKNVQHTQFSDGWLLVFLLVLAVTGFWLEIVVTLGLGGRANEMILLVHSAMAMELVLLMVFTKLAHALYRPMALFVHYLHAK